jgi:hypothetical protein
VANGLWPTRQVKLINALAVFAGSADAQAECAD